MSCFGRTSAVLHDAEDFEARYQDWAAALQGNATSPRRAMEGLTMGVTRGTDNVFEDLGFDAEEAANLKVRADLMLDLRKCILERGWTQEEAATFFDETQPRISNLMNGELGRFSIDKLIKMLTHAGMEVKVEVQKKAA